MNNDTRIEWEVVYRMGPRTYSQDCKQLEDGTIDCLWGRKKSIDDVIAFLKYENHWVDNDSIEVYKLTYRAESTYRYPSYGMDGKISGHNDAPRYRLVSREKYYPKTLKENKKMKVTENTLRKIIRESLYEIAKVPRGGNFLATVQNLIAQANNAYNEAAQKCEDDTPLMDREGDSYGLVGQIVLTKTGVVKFTLKYALSREPETHVVKVMSVKRNGDVVPIQGDYWEEGWKDVRKILNGIIKDAQRGMQYFTNYDPNIEELPAKQGKQAMRDFNKSIGRVPTAGADIF